VNIGTNEKQNEKISEYEQQILENESRILLGKRKDAKYQYKLKKKTDSKATFDECQSVFLLSYYSINYLHN
jgi:hypothetical protein